MIAVSGAGGDIVPGDPGPARLTSQENTLVFPSVGGPERFYGALFVAGSGAVAQLGERCNRTAEVTGSIPVSSTLKKSSQWHAL